MRLNCLFPNNVPLFLVISLPLPYFLVRISTIQHLEKRKDYFKKGQSQKKGKNTKKKVFNLNMSKAPSFIQKQVRAHFFLLTIPWKRKEKTQV